MKKKYASIESQLSSTSTLWKSFSSPCQHHIKSLYHQIVTRKSPFEIENNLFETNDTIQSNQNEEYNKEHVWALVAIASIAISRPELFDIKEIQENQDEPENEMDSTKLQRPWDIVTLTIDENIPFQIFLTFFSTLVDRLVLPKECVEACTILKRDLTTSCYLYTKYHVVSKRLIEAKIFQQEDEMEQLTWLVYLIAKRRLIRQYNGLGPLYFLLLGVLKVRITAIQLEKKENKTSLEANAVATLSALGQTSDDNTVTSDESDNDNKKILNILTQQPTVDPKTIDKAVEHAIAVIQSLIDDRQLILPSIDERATPLLIFSPEVASENLKQLTELYEREYLTNFGSFDERVYLQPSKRELVMGILPDESEANDKNAKLSTRASTGTADTNQRAGSRRKSSVDFTSPFRKPSTSASPYTTHTWQWQTTEPSPARSSFFYDNAIVDPTRNVPMNASRTLATSAVLGSAIRGSRSSTVPATPITSAVEINHWIHKLLNNHGPSNTFTQIIPPTDIHNLDEATSNWKIDITLSPQLDMYFRASQDHTGTDPCDFIVSQAQGLCRKLIAYRRQKVLRIPPLFQSSGQSAHSELDETLWKSMDLAVGLFFYVLEALLTSEEKRLKTNVFSSLLGNEKFIKSIFTCSFELMLRAHSLVTFAFPTILKILEVDPFEFGKMIESFVKVVSPQLPKSLQHHMRDVEIYILEDSAWRHDSGLYPLLKPESSSVTTTKAVLQLFYRKVLTLSASRIFKIGCILKMDAKYLNQVWTALKEVLSSHSTTVMVDRHLDTIILCCFYGIAKANHLPNVGFNQLVSSYKQFINETRPGALSQVLANTKLMPPTARVSKNIPLHLGPKSDDENVQYGNIIQFYNTCFVGVMKALILSFQSMGEQLVSADEAEARVSVPGTDKVTRLTVTSSVSDMEIVSVAAVATVEKILKLPPSSDGRIETATPTRKRPYSLMRSPPLARTRSPAQATSSSTRGELFRMAEVEQLPLSIHPSTPRRVSTSNVFVSPLHSSRLQSNNTPNARHSQLPQRSPGSSVRYAFGSSPARDLQRINRTVKLPLPSPLRAGILSHNRSGGGASTSKGLLSSLTLHEHENEQPPKRRKTSTLINHNDAITESTIEETLANGLNATVMDDHDEDQSSDEHQ